MVLTSETKVDVPNIDLHRKKANLNPRDIKDSFSYDDIRQNNKEPKNMAITHAQNSSERTRILRELQLYPYSTRNPAICNESTTLPSRTDLSELEKFSYFYRIVRGLLMCHFCLEARSYLLLFCMEGKWTLICLISFFRMGMHK